MSNDPLSRRSIWKSLKIDFNKGMHAGLLLQKCLEKQDDPEAKSALFSSACKNMKNVNTKVYRRAFDRWECSIKQFHEYTLVLKVVNRIIVGLGETNVLEAGLTLHHTYGVPYIPGSAVKGLAAHYCNKVYGQIDEAFKIGAPVHAAIFGTQDCAGLVHFNDAWILPKSVANSLHLDVLTPHHQEYYESRGNVFPTDFDTPVPVPFLSVSGDFLFSIMLETDHLPCELTTEERSILQLAKKILTDALCEEGIGGKTSSGYGKFRQTAKPQEGVVVRGPHNNEAVVGKITKIGNNFVTFTFEYEGTTYNAERKDNKKKKTYNGTRMAKALKKQGMNVGDEVQLLLVSRSDTTWVVNLHTVQKDPDQ